MNFPDALRHVIEGERITKKEWGDPRIYLELNEEYLMIHKADGSEHCIMLRDGDLLGIDWQVVADDRKKNHQELESHYCGELPGDVHKIGED